MGIEIIGKLTQKNNGDFKLVDLADVDYDGTGKSAKQELEKKIEEAKNSSTPYDDTKLKTDINTIKTDLGTVELTTTDKTVKGAINEVNAQYKDIVNNKADKDVMNKIKLQVESIQTEQDLNPNKDIELTSIRTNLVADTFPTADKRIENIERFIKMEKKNLNIEIVSKRELYATGDTGASGGYSVTKMIPVDEGDVVYYSGKGAIGAGTTKPIIAGYHSYKEGTYSGIAVDYFKSILLNSEGGTEYKHHCVIIPAGIKAIICQFRTDGSGTSDYGVTIYKSTDVNYSDFSTDLKNKLEMYYGYNIKSCVLKKYVARVGIEFNIYFDRLFLTTRPNDYIVVALENGVAIPTTRDYLRIVPDKAGDRTIHLIVRDTFAKFEIAHFVINLKVVEDSEISTTDKAIFIGDSLTDNTLKDNGLVDRIKEQLPNITFYGTRPGKNGVNTEGRAGWSSGDYMNKTTYAGMTNPFLNPSTSKFDFSYYIQQNPNFNDVTLVNLFLGQNDGYSTSFYTNLEYMINSIKQYNQNIKIYLCMTNFEANDRLPDVFKKRLESMNILKEKYEDKESENIFLVPQCINLDSFYDYGYGDKQISSRNTKTYLAITDGVHPNDFGRYKEADAWVSYYKYHNK